MSQTDIHHPDGDEGEPRRKLIEQHAKEVKELDVYPDEVLFVDDAVQNISYANALGIETHQYVAVAQFREYLKERTT